MGKITRLQLENFTCFAKLDVEFSPGVNILIGTNGTGKTHILKVLYAACAETWGEGQDRPVLFKLPDVFMPYGHGLERFRRRPLRQDAPGIARIVRENDSVLAVFLDEENNHGSSVKGDFIAAGALDSVYIPVKEMLAHAPGFISLTSKRYIAFEEVYSDIIKQAYLPRLKTLPNPAYEKIYKDLGEAMGGEVVLKGEYFFLKTGQEEFEFSMLAEGVRKIALLWLLVQNGSLNPGTILFWDEPEANLNPSLIGLVVETLLELQRQGVQVFLATHNYVLLKEFDLRKKPDDAVRYISLYRDETDSVAAESSDVYTGISPNAISDTFSDLYQRDIARALGRG